MTISCIFPSLANSCLINLNESDKKFNIMLAKSCEGNTSNPQNQLDSKRVLPVAGKFTPTAATAQSQPPTSLPLYHSRRGPLQPAGAGVGVGG